MQYPLIKDLRGSFQELAHNSDIKFGQLSYLTVNPLCTRGGHYHTRKDEWFCCIKGKCLMCMIDINTGKKREVELNEDNKEFIYIKPYESHSVKNLSKITPCELLVIISEEYNEKDPDTFKYEE